MSVSFDPNADFRAQLSELAKVLRTELEKADEHPLLHAGCEVLRAKIQKRDVNIPEMISKAPEQAQAIINMFIKNGQ